MANHDCRLYSQAHETSDRDDRRFFPDLEVQVNPPEKAVESRALERDECLRLISKGVVGRVVFTDAALPAVQPVRYLLDSERIIFRPITGSKLAVAQPAVVAFQVDEIDPQTGTGWSVVAVGQAYELTKRDRAELGEGQPAAWACAPAARVIAIPMHHLTGCRLSLNEGDN
jgi:hypothetical protein